MPLQHAADLDEPVIEPGSEFRKLRQQPPKVEFPDLRETLPPTFGRAGQLRQPMDQASPCVAGLPYVVAVDLRAVEQATKTRLHLHDLSPESFRAGVMDFTDRRRENLGDELALSGHEPTDRILEGLTATGRPDQEPDQAVARQTQRCFLGTGDNRLKIIDRVGAAGKCKERYREPGNLPEIPSGRTGHHVGAEAGEDGHADQAQPAILPEQSNESDGREANLRGPGQPQQALVQRFSDRRQGTERHRKGSPIGMSPVHGKGDAIGKHDGECSLDCRLDAIRQDPLGWHVLSRTSSCRGRGANGTRDLRTGMAGTILPFGAIVPTAGPAGKSHTDHVEYRARQWCVRPPRWRHRPRSEKTPARQTGSDGIAPRDNIGRHVPVIFYRATKSMDLDKNKDPLP